MSKERAGITIRSMEEGDIPVMPSLLKKCHLFCEEGNTTERLRRKLMFNDNLTLVAVVEAQIVGVMMASYDGWLAAIWHFGILDGFEGQGVAGSLLQELRQRIREQRKDFALKAGVGCEDDLLIHALVRVEDRALLRLLTMSKFTEGPKVVIVRHPA